MVVSTSALVEMGCKTPDDVLNLFWYGRICVCKFYNYCADINFRYPVRNMNQSSSWKNHCYNTQLPDLSSAT